MRKKLRKIFLFLRELHLNWLLLILPITNKEVLVQRVYLWSAVNMLTNSAKALDITKRDILQPYFPRSDEENWWTCCRVDFTSVWDPSSLFVTPCFKIGGLDIYLITSFAVHNFGNRQAVRTTVSFLKCTT